MSGVARVVLDANVVIAASIRLDFGGGDPIKHRIYDEAAALVSRLHECGNGYVLPAVRAEVNGALAQAVQDTLGKRRAGATAAEMKPLYYALASRSRVRAKQIIRSANAVELDPDHIASSLILVERMSECLMDRYEELTKRRSSAHGLSLDPRGAQAPPEAPQLGRFVRKYPNRGDQRVLAEAIAFRGSLPAGSRVMIASSDTGFFSPYRHSGGVSDAVTREIRERFGILCDHPVAILRAAFGPRRP